MGILHLGISMPARNVCQMDSILETRRKRQNPDLREVSSLGLDIVRDIGTFWKTNKELIWLPNIKQGFFGITQPTEAEMAKYR